MKKSLGAILLLIAHAAAFGGIIRHDVAPRKYEQLAHQRQFDCVGSVSYLGKARGSCVLIGKQLVLTAAHLFVEHDYHVDTVRYGDQTVILNKPSNARVGDTIRYLLTFNGRRYHAARLQIFPAYFDPETQGECDLALVQLAEPVRGVAPASINHHADELHSAVVGVGYGATGIANKPETVTIDAPAQKLAGENTIDSLGGLSLNNLSTLLLCDFDHPTNGLCNKMGSPVPCPLEYLCSGGDSGGGLFRKTGNAWELVGICWGSRTDISQLRATGYYGQIMGWTRVAAFAEWVDEQSSQK